MALTTILSSCRVFPSACESSICLAKVGQVAGGPKEPDLSESDLCGVTFRATNTENENPFPQVGNEQRL